MKDEPRTETIPMPYMAPTSTVDIATLELLASWRAQDATDDPEELRAAEQELEDFKRVMNENRAAAGEPLIYP